MSTAQFQPDAPEWEVNLEAMRRVLIPKRGPMMPPDWQGETTIIQSLSLWLQAPATPSNYLDPKTQSVIFFPRRDCISIHRYSLFPRTYTQDYSSYTGTWIYLGTTFGFFAGKNGSEQNGVYIPVEDSRDVQLSPDIASAMTRGRLIGGSIRFKSDATSTTSAAISGTFNCGVLGDTRGGFAPSSLPQSTVTRKDTYLNHPCQRGIVEILGSDIQDEFAPVDRSLAIYDDNTAFQVLYDQLATASTAWCPSYASQSQASYSTPAVYAASSMWLSPTFQPAGTNAAQFVLQTPAINLTAEPVIRLNAFITHLDPGAGNDKYAMLCTATIAITHFWAYEVYDPTMNSNQGGFRIQLITSDNGTEYHNLNVGMNMYGALGGTYRPIACGQGCATEVVTSRARKPTRYAIPPNNTYGTTNLPTFVAQNNLMYAGSLVQLITSDLTGADGFSPRIGISRVEFQDPDLYSNNSSLSANFVEWRNLAPGQNIDIEGLLYVQGPATSSVAPYVQSQFGNTSAVLCTSHSVLEMLDLLFNSDSCQEFKRIWDMQDYDERCYNFANALTVDALMALVRNLDASKRRVLNNYMKAAGFFDTLKKFGSNLVKAVPRVARTIADVAPHIRTGLSAAEKYAQKAATLAEALSGPAMAAAGMAAAGHLGKRSRSHSGHLRTAGMMGTTADFEDDDVDFVGEDCGADGEDCDFVFSCAGNYFFDNGATAAVNTASTNDFLSGGKFCQVGPQHRDVDDHTQIRCDAVFAALYPEIAKVAGENAFTMPRVQGGPVGWLMSRAVFNRALAVWRKLTGRGAEEYPADVAYLVGDDFVYVIGGFNWKTGRFNPDNVEYNQKPQAALFDKIKYLMALLGNGNLSAAKKRSLARQATVSTAYSNAWDKILSNLSSKPYAGKRVDSTAGGLAVGWHNLPDHLDGTELPAGFQAVPYNPEAVGKKAVSTSATAAPGVIRFKVPKVLGDGKAFQEAVSKAIDTAVDRVLGHPLEYKLGTFERLGNQIKSAIFQIHGTPTTRAKQYSIAANHLVKELLETVLSANEKASPAVKQWTSKFKAQRQATISKLDPPSTATATPAVVAPAVVTHTAIGYPPTSGYQEVDIDQEPPVDPFVH